MTGLEDFTVGDRVVSPSLSQIRNGEETVHVEPRSIDVLIALAESGGEVRSKKELIEAVWGAAFVSDEVLTHAIWDLRRAFGDDASHPRFIQTIPKRGYRLIAPVEMLGPASASPRWPMLARYAAAGLVAIAAVVAALVWWRGDAGSPAAEAERRLIVASPERDSAHAEIQQRFYDDLLAELAGAKGLEVLARERCELSEDSAPALCLTLGFDAFGDSYEIHPRLSDAHTGELAWAPARSLLTTEAPAASRSAARTLKQLVNSYLRILDMDFYSDDDIRPWFDFSRHDTRAIGDFLEGVHYVYTNQSGGRNPLDVAAARDPDFVAPRVWRIPTLAADGSEPGRLATYLDDLRRLYPTADSFERPMIQWALAIADGNVRKQLHELSIALEQEPGNRPVRFMLGMTRFQNGDLEGAWQLLEPLADRQWRHPGLYWATASCAIMLERLAEAEEFLDQAASRRPVDAETFELLELLAIYRDDVAAAARHRESKITRLSELDEPYLFDAAPFADKLAAMALAEGRQTVAKNLREFSD